MGQAASLGLTQYDVDELIAYSKGACEWWWVVGAHSAREVTTLAASGVMATVTAPLLAVNQQEIESLYKRFRALDRGRKVRQGCI